MAIEIGNVGVVVETVSVLNNIDICLTHRRIGVVGSNGSGKSTFARLLNGLVKPTTGCVCVAGLDTKTQGKKVRQQVGFVFQNPDQQMVLPTVIEDIAFGLCNQGLTQPEAKKKALNILEQYNLAHLQDSFTYQISGGEKQMVALLGVLVMQPRWLILDEPTTLLDYKNTNKIMQTLHNLEQHIVFVTHNLDLLQDFDNVLYFKAGHLVEHGSPSDVIKAYLDE